MTSPPLDASGKGGSENSRTRALTTSPPRVSIVSRIFIVSIQLQLAVFHEMQQKCAHVRAYIWLA